MLRTTAIIYLIALWILLLVRVHTYGGISGGGISSLLMVVLVSGLLLGPWVSFTFTGLSVLGIFILVALDQAVSAESFSLGSNAMLRMLSIVANFGVVSIFIWFATRNYSSTLIEAQSTQSKLLESSNRLEAAAEIASLASETLDLGKLRLSLVNALIRRFGFYYVGLYTLDVERRVLVLNAEASSDGDIKVSENLFIPLNETSIVANVARTRQAYLTKDIRNDPLYLANKDLPNTKSELAMPVVAGDKLYGVLDILSDGKPLSWDEVNVMQVISNQIGSAIHNVILQDKRQRHIEELEALHAIGTAGLESISEDELVARATRVVGQSLFPRNFGVLLVDYELGQLVHHLSYSDQRSSKQPAIALGEGITGLVALSGQPMRIGDVSREPKYISVDTAARSELCVPIKIGTRVLGVLNVESDMPNAFTEDDERLLMTLAGQLAISMEKIRLFSEAQERAKELSKALAKQDDLNRLKNEFIQNVSHEFRTPLSIVSGYIEMVQAGEFGPIPKDFKQPMQIINRRIGLLSKLVNDLTAALEVQNRDQTFEAVSLAQLMEAMKESLDTKAKGKQLAIELELNPDCSPVFGEPTFLIKAIDNLIGNAIKFTPAQGRIHIRLRSEGKTVYFEVEDTGIGIAAKEQERIFERFYQVDGSSTREYGGTGIGLALVREIVELHDGDIQVSSRLGKGSRFIVRLPAYLELNA